MGYTRTAALAARPVEYANATLVTVTTESNSCVLLGLADDRVNTFWRGTGQSSTAPVGTQNKLYISPDRGTTMTTVKEFNDRGWFLDGVLETPGGELLVTVTRTATRSEVWRSTGWNPANPTAATWSRVWQAPASGVYVRARWGLSPWGIAPAWSRHAGMLFMCEYGPQAGGTGAPAVAADAAVRAYRSADDGATWSVIFNLLEYKAALWPTETRFHTHAISYDPWTNRVLLSFGDGGNAAPGHCGVVYSDNPEATAPTWTLIEGTSTATSRDQVTNVAALEVGVLLLPDGLQSGLKIITRRRNRKYGPLTQLALCEGYNIGPIGSYVHRNGYLAAPSPGMPIFACNIESGTTGRKPAIWSSVDGYTWREFYRHPTTTSGGAPGIDRVFGPTLDGKIIAYLNPSGTGGILTMDYRPATLGA